MFSALDHVKKFRAAMAAVLDGTLRLGRTSIPFLSKRTFVRSERLAPAHRLLPSALRPYLMRSAGQPGISDRKRPLGPRAMTAGPERPDVRGTLPFYQERPKEALGRGGIMRAAKAASGGDDLPTRRLPPDREGAYVPKSGTGTANPATHFSGTSRRRLGQASALATLPFKPPISPLRINGANRPAGRPNDWHARQPGYAPLSGPADASTRFRGPLAPRQGTANMGPNANIEPGRQNSVGSVGPTLGEDAGLGQAGSAGVIHLDGNVLGQWMIDHLERSLSKPSTGTTGLNPRASTTWIGSPLLT